MVDRRIIEEWLEKANYSKDDALKSKDSAEKIAETIRESLRKLS